jgi:hypothetical protein
MVSDGVGSVVPQAENETTAPAIAKISERMKAS